LHGLCYRSSHAGVPNFPSGGRYPWLNEPPSSFQRLLRNVASEANDIHTLVSEGGGRGPIQQQPVGQRQRQRQQQDVAEAVTATEALQSDLWAALEALENERTLARRLALQVAELEEVGPRRRRCSCRLPHRHSPAGPWGSLSRPHRSV